MCGLTSEKLQKTRPLNITVKQAKVPLTEEITSLQRRLHYAQSKAAGMETVEIRDQRWLSLPMWCKGIPDNQGEEV